MSGPEILIQVGYGLLVFAACGAIAVDYLQQDPPFGFGSNGSYRGLAKLCAVMAVFTVLPLLLPAGPWEFVPLMLVLALGIRAAVHIRNRRKVSR